VELLWNMYREGNKYETDAGRRKFVSQLLNLLVNSLDTKSTGKP